MNQIFQWKGFSVPFCARNFMECEQKTTMNNRVHL